MCLPYYNVEVIYSRFSYAYIIYGGTLFIVVIKRNLASKIIIVDNLLENQ